MTTKDTKFEGARGPAPVRGVAWQFDQVFGRWNRTMMRVHLDGTAYWSSCTRLNDPEIPFCMQCFSNNVSIEMVSTQEELLCCHDCEAGYFRIVTE